MKKSFSKDKRGVAAVEMAIILPVLILIIMGVLFYGLYFIKYGIVNRSVATAATAIQVNPGDTSIETLAKSSGATLVNYTSSPNYICAQSYSTQGAAQAGRCAGGWVTTRPGGMAAGAPYYVAISAFVQKGFVVPLMSSLIPDIKSSVVVKVANLLPTCLDGQTLTYSVASASFVCEDSNVYQGYTVQMSETKGRNFPDGTTNLTYPLDYKKEKFLNLYALCMATADPTAGTYGYATVNITMTTTGGNIHTGEACRSSTNPGGMWHNETSGNVFMAIPKNATSVTITVGGGTNPRPMQPYIMLTTMR